MDVALYEETPRSGYENENMNGSMKIISSASFDAFIERRVARIYVSRVFCPHILFHTRFTRLCSFFLHVSLFKFFSFVIRYNPLAKNDEKWSRVDSRFRSNDKFVHANPFLLCSRCIPNNVDMLTHCLL